MSGARAAEEREREDGFYAHPVRAVPLGPPSAALLETIRAHVLDDAILETNEPYVWAAQASNDREDAYATRMHRSTLDNFATDATAGVAFMNSHRTGGFIGSAELPLGRTIEGTRLECGGRLAWFAVSREQFAAASAAEADAEGLVEYLRLIEGVRVAIFLLAAADGTGKVSFRSDGIDVNRFASTFGGGGHRHASGATIPGALDAVVTPVIEAAKATLFP